MTFNVSPGVYPITIDLSERTQGVATSIGAIVGASNRGPLAPTFVSDSTRFANLYGLPDPTIGYMHDSSIFFLDQSRQHYVKRVVGEGTLYAVGLFANDWLNNTPTYNGTSFLAVDGSPFDWENGTRPITDLVFSAAFVTSNTINLSVNASAITSVNYTTSSNNTLALVAAAIQQKLNILGDYGKAEVVDFSENGLTDDRIIRIVPPLDANGAPIEITLTGIAVTSGVSQPTGQQRTTDILFWVFSENPGAWGNNLAVKITNLDSGRAERHRLTFSAALVTGNSFSCTVNGYAVGPVTFNSDSDTTMDDIAAEIQSVIIANVGAGAVAEVYSVGGSGSNDRIINVIAPAAPIELTFDDFSVTGGASQAVVTSRKTLNKIDPTGQFTLEVYEYPNLSSPVESWRLSLEDSVDGFGDQLNIEYAINDGPKKSSYIRVNLNEAYEDRVVLNNTTISNATRLGFLAGADDGLAVTTAEIVTGWDDFMDVEKMAIRILMNGGNGTPEIHQKITAVCERRRDCVGVLDIPSDNQLPQEAYNFRRQEMNVDSSYVAVYSPDPLIYDQYTAKRRYVPPSGLVAAQYAYTDVVAREWFAPAGLNRGLIKRALDLRHKYNEGDRDLLSPEQVNCIRKMGPRFPIWGEYTTQVRPSALQSVPVRRCLNTIEIALAESLAYSNFEPNDPQTRYRIKQLCNNFLETIKQGRGLNEYETVCDERNNTGPIIDARQLYVDVYLKPNLPALYIRLRSIVTKQGARFDELIESGAANSSGV